MIKNIIFDIGNVLVTFDTVAYFSTYFDEKVNHFLCDAVFQSQAWKDVDQGLISEKDAKKILLEALPNYHKELTLLFNNWKPLMQEKKDTLDLLRHLKEEGYGIYILSNIGKESYEYCVEHFSFFDYAHGGIYSYEEKFIKPDEKIYTCLLDRYELLPGECIFLDDANINIERAKQLGIHGLLFTHAKKAEVEIRDIIKGELDVKN